MEMKNYKFLILLVLLLCFSRDANLCLGGDSISANESLSIGQTIVSSGGNFELGFFRPGNSPNYYIGIWYKKFQPQTVVWVANRETPVTTTEAKLTTFQGNLALVDQFQNTIWSTQVGNVTTNNAVIAFLGDDGNLILTRMSNSSTPLPLWQSFDNPTDTLMPGAKIGYDKRTQKKQVLISWKNSNDPAPGLFSLELDPIAGQVIIKWNRTMPYWTSGTWEDNKFSLVPMMRLNYMYINSTYIDNENETYFTYSIYKNSTFTSREIMDVSGQIKQQAWFNDSNGWNQFWVQPSGQCEVYAYCGAFGVCDSTSSSCNCLNGFKPRSDSEWNSGDHSGGCVRIGKLRCSANSEDKDSFWMDSRMTLPAPQDTNITVGEASQCRYACFNDCSCTAYTYDQFGACSIWTGDLFNLHILDISLHIRFIDMVAFSRSEFDIYSAANSSLQLITPTYLKSCKSPNPLTICKNISN